MTALPQALSGYPRYKLLLVALLACNAVIYGFIDTLGSTLDAVAWLILLILFELETEFSSFVASHRATRLIHGARSVAIVGATLATLSYVLDGAWIDMLNSAIWVAIIVLLEWEVRYPRAAMAHKRLFITSTASLYAGLLVVVGLWIWTGDWFDAYDAILWIIAYITIELDVMRFSERAASADAY